jgi:hypothetical protein
MDQDIRQRYRQTSHNRRQTQPNMRPLVTTQNPAHDSKPPPINQAPPIKHQPVSLTPPVHHRPKTKRSKKFKMLIILLILAALGIAGKLLIFPRYSQTNPFSPAIQSSLNIPLFYPQKMPKGYLVDHLSFRTTSNEVVFNANHASSRLVFTQQKIPAGFDFNVFYAQHLTNTTVFSTPYGSVVVGKNDNRTLGSLISDKTWLLLTTNSQQPSVDDMSLVLKNLKRY